MSEVNEGGAPKTQLKVSEIQGDLNNGLSRAQIQAKYNLSGKDLKSLFSHHKLKGLKTKPAPSFVLEDDTPDKAIAETPVVANTTNEVEAPLEENNEEVKVGEEF